MTISKLKGDKKDHGNKRITRDALRMTIQDCFQECITTKWSYRQEREKDSAIAATFTTSLLQDMELVVA
ncbi:MAG: hypothetical protein WCK85_11210 [Chlorobium sp.]